VTGNRPWSAASSLVLDRLTEAAPAKVNLYLHLIGRRDDGYHLLDSLVAFAEIGDVVHAEPAETLSLRVVGPFSAELSAESDNLVLRAARALATEVGVTIGARMVLEKRLPVASGIGGGSADAAAALRLLCRLWGLSPDSAVLARLSAGLGADVPACLFGRTCRMGGIGERLEPVSPLPQCDIVLVNPGTAVATADVFRNRRGAWSSWATLPAGWADRLAMAHDLAPLRNDLESAAVTLRPVIADVLTALAASPGCLLARMSGSGATCFGLFADRATAGRAVSEMQRSGWWCWSGSLLKDFTLPGTRPMHELPDGA
jgi:4-diphosphocytidyl-2-C-methyl-D-erythritol kinase